MQRRINVLYLMRVGIEMFEILDVKTLQSFVAFSFTVLAGMLMLWLFYNNDNDRWP